MTFVKISLSNRLPAASNIPKSLIAKAKIRNASYPADEILLADLRDCPALARSVCTSQRRTRFAGGSGADRYPTNARFRRVHPQSGPAGHSRSDCPVPEVEREHASGT